MCAFNAGRAQIRSVSSTSTLERQNDGKDEKTRNETAMLSKDKQKAEKTKGIEQPQAYVSEGAGGMGGW